ncbi:MAG: hypothetical protein Q8P48_03540, partial [Deltaproteobacteria bacterium]|nr:hypothetical protein [Deltaproteobacteria bacterium]
KKLFCKINLAFPAIRRMDFFSGGLRKGCGKTITSLRLLKKLQMRGVEKRGMRRIFVYAAVTSDEDNEADGLFQRPDKKEKPP